MERAGAGGVHSMGALPLLVGGRVLGAMTLGFHGSRLSDDERSFAVMAAEHVARALDRVLALDRAGAYEAEARARAAAEAANLAKDEFLSTLSHELRTPLTSILGWANILRRRAVEPALARGLETIERNARTQVRLLEDVLDVSRIVTGKLRLSIRTVDPAAVVRGALDVTRPAAEGKGVRVEATIDAVGTLAGDPVRLQQVVWNLLTNAVKSACPRAAWSRCALTGTASACGSR